MRHALEITYHLGKCKLVIHSFIQHLSWPRYMAKCEEHRCKWDRSSSYPRYRQNRQIIAHTDTKCMMGVRKKSKEANLESSSKDNDLAFKLRPKIPVEVSQETCIDFCVCVWCVHKRTCAKGWGEWTSQREQQQRPRGREGHSGWGTSWGERRR